VQRTRLDERGIPNASREHARIVTVMRIARNRVNEVLDRVGGAYEDARVGDIFRVLHANPQFQRMPAAKQQDVVLNLLPWETRAVDDATSIEVRRYHLDVVNNALAGGVPLNDVARILGTVNANHISMANGVDNASLTAKGGPGFYKKVHALQQSVWREYEKAKQFGAKGSVPAGKQEEVRLVFDMFLAFAGAAPATRRLLLNKDFWTKGIVNPIINAPKPPGVTPSPVKPPTRTRAGAPIIGETWLENAIKKAKANARIP
jgi:hypothetical protein